MKKVPQIAIVGWLTGQESFGATRAYLQHLSQYGDVRILTPKQGIDEDLDLVVMPGGKDISTYIYGQIPTYYNSDADQFKELFMLNNLPQYIDAGIPVWGTCLGFQQLVVHFKGKLAQNLYGHPTSKPEERGELVHEIIFNQEFLKLEIKLTRENGKKNIKTCSLHHQGVMDDEDFPECLDVIGKTKDGVVEFMQHKTLPVAGGQSHAEEDYNVVADYFIKSLISRSPNLKNENERTTLATA